MTITRSATEISRDNAYNKQTLTNFIAELTAATGRLHPSPTMPIRNEIVNNFIAELKAYEDLYINKFPQTRNDFSNRLGEKKYGNDFSNLARADAILEPLLTSQNPIYVELSNFRKKNTKLSPEQIEFRKHEELPIAAYIDDIYLFYSKIGENSQQVGISKKLIAGLLRINIIISDILTLEAKDLVSPDLNDTMTALKAQASNICKDGLLKNINYSLGKLEKTTEELENAHKALITKPAIVIAPTTPSTTAAINTTVTTPRKLEKTTDELENAHKASISKPAIVIAPTTPSITAALDTTVTTPPATAEIAPIPQTQSQSTQQKVDATNNIGADAAQNKQKLDRYIAEVAPLLRGGIFKTLQKSSRQLEVKSLTQRLNNLKEKTGTCTINEFDQLIQPVKYDISKLEATDNLILQIFSHANPSYKALLDHQARVMHENTQYTPEQQAFFKDEVNDIVETADSEYLDYTLIDKKTNKIKHTLNRFLKGTVRVSTVMFNILSTSSDNNSELATLQSQVHTICKVGLLSGPDGTIQPCDNDKTLDDQYDSLFGKDLPANDNFGTAFPDRFVRMLERKANELETAFKKSVQPAPLLPKTITTPQATPSAAIEPSFNGTTNSIDNKPTADTEHPAATPTPEVKQNNPAAATTFSLKKASFIALGIVFASLIIATIAVLTGGVSALALAVGLSGLAVMASMYPATAFIYTALALSLIAGTITSACAGIYYLVKKEGKTPQTTKTPIPGTDHSINILMETQSGKKASFDDLAHKEKPIVVQAANTTTIATDTQQPNLNHHQKPGMVI